MIKQMPDEDRATYLVRVAIHFCLNNSDMQIDYDETTCDGMCLADELAAEFGIELG